MSDRLKITREKLMQLPKDELVTELLCALEFVVSQHAASMHAELVAALEDTIRMLTAVQFSAGLGRKQLERIEKARAILQKAKQR